jgi:hypothetical protein
MKEQAKEIVQLPRQPFLVFQALEKRLKEITPFPVENPSFDLDEITSMALPLFAEKGLDFNKTATSGVVHTLAEKGILKRPPLGRQRGAGSKSIVEFDLGFLETHEVIQKPHGNSSDNGPPNELPPPPPTENEDGGEFVHGPEPDVPRLRIMLPLPDFKTKYPKNVEKYLKEENEHHPFKILAIEEYTKLEAQDFILSVPNASFLKNMFFKDSHDDSYLEVIIKEKAPEAKQTEAVTEKKEGMEKIAQEKKKLIVLIVARGYMECYLNGDKDEMVTDKKYEIKPNIPYLFRIGTIMYLMRALGF